MSDLRCPTCNARHIEFAELPACISCCDAQVLSKEKSIEFVHEKFSEARETAIRAAEEVGQDFWPYVYGVIDGLYREFQPDLIKVNYTALGVLDGITSTMHSATQSMDFAREYSADRAAANTVISAGQAITSLRALKYQLEQDSAALVQYGSSEDSTKSWLAPYQTMTPRDSEWKAWTLIGYGRGPDFEEIEHEFTAAIRDDFEGATVFEVASSFDLDIRPLNNQSELQIQKRYAPTIATYLRTLREVDVRIGTQLANRLSSLCARTLDLDTWLGEAYLDDPLPSGSYGAKRISAPILQMFLNQRGVGDLLPLVARTGNVGGIIAPLFVYQPIGDQAFFVYSRVAIQQFALFLRNFKTVDGDEMGRLASVEFERLIAHVLWETGYAVHRDGALLRGVSLQKGGKDEIDVLCWDGSHILLVEAKFEIDPPGEWTNYRVERRIGKLSKYVDTLGRKAQAWQDRLEEPVPEAYKEGVGQIELPPNLSESRTIEHVVISGRVEPRAATGPGRVLTYMPEAAASVAKRRLPLGKLCPIWTGTERLGGILSQDSDNDTGDTNTHTG